MIALGQGDTVADVIHLVRTQGHRRLYDAAWWLALEDAIDLGYVVFGDQGLELGITFDPIEVLRG